MQARVALVEARPETILDDFRRVLQLAGLESGFAESDPQLVAGRWGGDWFPGTGTTPWQLDGALAMLRRADAGVAPQRQVLVVDPVSGAPVAGRRGAAWQGVLDRAGASAFDPLAYRCAPVHPSGPLPSLAAALRGAPTCPAPMQGKPVLLMPVPRWCDSWPLAGSIELLGALLGPQHRRPQAPLSEVRAESLALARELFPQIGVLMDATVWGICRGGSVEPVARNVLLAGNDPVAVDAVAARLIEGSDRPAPWLDLCARRGLGVAASDRIEWVGSTELANLDFQLPADTLGAPGRGPHGGVPGRWMWRWWGRRRRLAAFAGTAWGRLYDEYRSGRLPGETR